MTLPKLTQEPIKWVDLTPDQGLPLRILRAYRQDCDCRWSDTAEGTDTENPILKMMNEHCEQRAVILDEAIARLEGSPND